MSQNPVRLADCPPGLFMFGTTLGFRSEYATTTESNPNQPDAYVVDSGEYFWGGCTTSLDRSDLMVVPLAAVDARLIAAAPDLLAALKALDAQGHTQATWDFAKRAMAKAEGWT